MSACGSDAVVGNRAVFSVAVSGSTTVMHAEMRNRIEGIKYKLLDITILRLRFGRGIKASDMPIGQAEKERKKPSKPSPRSHFHEPARQSCSSGLCTLNRRSLGESSKL